MPKTLNEIAKTIDIGRSFVQNPIPKLFLCGGARSKPGNKPTSLRGQLIVQLETADGGLQPDIVLAEEAVTWYHSLTADRFPNLVELEACIAALSTQILLIVESAGSMTELGAFSFDDRLSKKLYVVSEKSYETEQSFIMDGPIAKIRSGAGRFYSYDWLKVPKKTAINHKKAKSAAQRIIKNIILPAMSRPVTPQTFDQGNDGHRMLLISDLVSLGGALRRPEIFGLVRVLGVPLNRKELARYLFLLEKLRFLRHTHEGGDDYYFPANPTVKFVTYETSDGKPFDRDRYRAYMQEALAKRSNYEDRKNVLAAASKGA